VPSSARARSDTCAVSSIGVPGGNSSESMLRPWSDTGMKVVGMNGISASEPMNSSVATPSVFQRLRNAVSTQPR